MDQKSPASYLVLLRVTTRVILVRTTQLSFQSAVSCCENVSAFQIGNAHLVGLSLLKLIERRSDKQVGHNQRPCRPIPRLRCQLTVAYSEIKLKQNTETA